MGVNHETQDSPSEGLGSLFPHLSRNTSLGQVPQGTEDIMGANTASVLLALEAQ